MKSIGNLLSALSASLPMWHRIMAEFYRATYTPKKVPAMLLYLLYAWCIGWAAWILISLAI